MKKILPFFFLFLFYSLNLQAANISVYSANGFTCGRMGLRNKKETKRRREEFFS